MLARPRGWCGMPTQKYTVEDSKKIILDGHDDFPGNQIVEIEGRRSRWHRWTTAIYEDADGQCWAVHYGDPLTEMQEAEINEAPVMVEQREIVIPARKAVAWYRTDGDGDVMIGKAEDL